MVCSLGCVSNRDYHQFVLYCYNNNNNEILIKREPLVYTRARRAVQTKTKKQAKERKARTVQQQ